MGQGPRAGVLMGQFLSSQSPVQAGWPEETWEEE